MQKHTVVVDISSLFSCCLCLQVIVCPELIQMKSYLCVRLWVNQRLTLLLSYLGTQCLCVIMYMCFQLPCTCKMRLWTLSLGRFEILPNLEKLIIGLHCTYEVETVDRPPSVLCIPILFFNMHHSRELSLDGILEGLGQLVDSKYYKHWSSRG